MDKGPQIREGKAKILYETKPSSDRLIQYFKDDATAFNALKKGTIQEKGIINNEVSSGIFKYLSNAGVKTHFVERLTDREMLVQKVEIIPVEVVVRNRAAGSILKRLGLEKGKTFTPALVEYFYKSDALGDPLIGEGHIDYFGWATPKEMAFLKEQSLRVNEALSKLFREAGIELIDFKLEFGRKVGTGEILLADEFTPDGSRLWDLKTGEPMDKDRFRHDLGKVEESYQEVLKRLRPLLNTK